MFLICTREDSPTYRNYFASSSALFERKIPWEFPVAMQWAIFFCRLFFLFTKSIFYFAAGISLWPLPSSFCREHFSFAGSYFLLPWPVSFLPWKFFFCRDQFLFCRGSFSFAGSFFLLPWHLWTTVGNSFLDETKIGFDFFQRAFVKENNRL